MCRTGFIQGVSECPTLMGQGENGALQELMRYIPLGTGSFLATITLRIATHCYIPDPPVPISLPGSAPLPSQASFASRRPSRLGTRHLDLVGASLWVRWVCPGDKTDIHYIRNTTTLLTRRSFFASSLPLRIKGILWLQTVSGSFAVLSGTSAASVSLGHHCLNLFGRPVWLAG